MLVTVEQHIRQCGCRSLDECWHDPMGFEAEERALTDLVNRFAAKMKRKLIHKMKKGRHGWDEPEWTPAMIRKALIEHLEKPNADMVDVANFAAFLWNRQAAEEAGQ